MSNRDSFLSKAVVICSILVVAVVAATTIIISNGFKHDNSQAAVSSSNSQSVISSSTDSAQVSSAEPVQTPSVASQTSTVSSQPVPTVSSSALPLQDDDELVCYLTFDDGPSKNVTPRILETLAKYDAKATFFVVGTSYLDELGAIKDAGHAIGLHSNTHQWNIYGSTDAYFADLEALSDKVYEKIGVRTKLIRFPGGSSNTKSKGYSTGIMTKLTKMVTEKGYIYVDWNVTSGDANGNNVPKDTIVNNVLKGAVNKNGKPYKKICVLMHDLGTKKTTADALPEIMEGLKNLGYTFKSLDENSPEFHHHVNN